MAIPFASASWSLGGLLVLLNEAANMVMVPDRSSGLGT